MGRFSNSNQSTAAQTNSQLHSVNVDQSKQNSSFIGSQLNYSGEVAQPNSITPDYICFSHLRWDFVYQRPQHLMSRCARDRRVFFVEEPIFSATEPKMEVSRQDCGVFVVKPHLRCSLSEPEITLALQALVIDDLILDHNIREYVLWYYTPMALSFTEHLEPLAIIYDCMDELSAFKNPPKGLKEREAELLKRADLVFTGGHSLYEAKRHLHSNIYPFPSSIDASHFRRARHGLAEPADQAGLPRPRLGFFGVIDERFDIELLDSLAKKKPEWQFVIIGPIVKIDPEELPTHPNIHYTGAKSYQELPSYLSGWDIAMLPFARNDSTRFISPTKTPEYLSAGIPVISTSIQDVIRPYGKQGLVTIADNVDDFVDAATFLMSEKFDRVDWLRRVDETLLYNSWELTWARMSSLVDSTLELRYPETEDSLSEVSSKSSSLKSIAVSPALGD
jgi:glycosyltransferase involved in cell wall biosynthesis